MQGSMRRAGEDGKSRVRTGREREDRVAPKGPVSPMDCSTTKALPITVPQTNKETFAVTTKPTKKHVTKLFVSSAGSGTEPGHHPCVTSTLLLNSSSFFYLLAAQR